MTSNEIRQKFLSFFESKAHKIVPSAPLVNKTDPTLMFVNAGMNPFKDYFLGNKKPKHKRVVDTQKCLRVSGKHNDLEDVGIDGYHHTLFEMLGNWSFGDYFKKEAIEWAWELLTEELKLDRDRLYITVFGGDEKDGLPADDEARKIWTALIEDVRVLNFDKKDNFWEMGATGPCGPCSEIHMDLRPDSERQKVDGKSLVNMDHPDVIEIWNLVFIQFNRKADSSLVPLPNKHIDTGMGFERLCRAIQKVPSNYDTDVFTPLIKKVESLCGLSYSHSFDLSSKKDIAFRVVVDHVRAVAFAIADGQMPSNTGAGYVIRRILRRAVRYYYSFLSVDEPLLYKLIADMADQLENIFPELKAQIDLIEKVILEEERSFLRTLESGLKRFDQLRHDDKVINGEDVFELYDTFGFPVDLTRLLASEQGLIIDESGFEKALEDQRSRSRADAKTDFGDWTIIHGDHGLTHFLGYDSLHVEDAHILKYREVDKKDKKEYQVVLDKSPFYPEGGGQVGDRGLLTVGDDKIKVINTVKDNDMIIHIVNRLPSDTRMPVKCEVDDSLRQRTENNHTATHLLHAALREVLGTHVQQRGSLVHPDYLRFDFSHFQKVSDEELKAIEDMVNDKIRANINRNEAREVSMAFAQENGAMMLFGEKYGDKVRMITFDPSYSVELCGGCHVESTGQIGLFKILSESAISAGIRRIEAVTSQAALEWVNQQLNELSEVKQSLKNPKEVVKAVQQLNDEVKALRKEMDAMKAKSAGNLKSDLLNSMQKVAHLKIIHSIVPLDDSKLVKSLVHQLTNEEEDMAVILGNESNGKPMINIGFSKNIAGDKLHAGKIIKEIGPLIKGGGGGQPFLASAGGSDINGLKPALEKAVSIIEASL